jgi:hypothetical protein
MHHLEVTAWTARLGHLLVTERLGFSHVRFPGDVPVAARSRTARHLARQGADAIEAVCEAWPGAATLPIWPDFHRTLIEQPDLGPPPAPMARRGFVDASEPCDGDAPSLLGRLLQRLTYLHDEEEFQGHAFGLLTLSDAWRACQHDVVNPIGNLLEIYLDSRSPTLRSIVRFMLRNHRVIDEWRTIDDQQLFERFAASMDRQPDTLAAAPPEQIDRLRRVGALSAKFRRLRPLADMDDDEPPLPLARVPSSHFDLHPLREPALLTMSPVFEPRVHE